MPKYQTLNSQDVLKAKVTDRVSSAMLPVSGVSWYATQQVQQFVFNSPGVKRKRNHTYKLPASLTHASRFSIWSYWAQAAWKHHQQIKIP